jgi:hypothetical protein
LPGQQQTDPLTVPDRPGQEGFYPMRGPQGETKGVPYSKVEQAIKQGHLFTDKNNLAQYARDYTADPANQDAPTPWWAVPGKSAVDQYRGFSRGMAKSITGRDRPPTTQEEQRWQLFSATPNTTMSENMGETAENLMEFKGGQKLLGMLTDYFKGAIGLADAAPIEKEIKKGTLLGKLALSALEQGTVAGTQTYAKTGDTGAALQSGALTGGLGLVIPGVSATWQAGKALIGGPAEAAAAGEAAATAARQEAAIQNAATINKAAQAERDAAEAANAARQQAASTNAARINDMAQLERDRAAAAKATARGQAAATSAATINKAAQAERDAAAQAAATRHAAATQNAAAINKAAQAERDAAEAAQAARPGTAEYAQQAQEAARPALEQGGVSREVTMAQPGGAPPAATGQRVAIATGRNVENTIAKMQDFTGAADRLEEHGQPIYDEFDRVTDGRFRKLNGEVQSAKQAMYDGEKGADELYQQKQQQMAALMDSTQGAMKPDQLAAGKALWTQQYALRDVGDLLDKSINRVPGSTEPAAGADINGNTMLKGLQRIVARYKGRARVDEILGPGRLDALEGIAQANTTAAKKQAFQQAFTTVQEQLELLAKAEAAAAKAKGPKFQYEFTSPEAEHQKLLDAETAAAQKAAGKQGFKYEFTTPEEEHDKLLKAERAAQRANKPPKFQYEFTTPEAEHEKLLQAEGPAAKPGGESKKLVHAVGESAAKLVGAGAARAVGLSWYEGMIAGKGMYNGSRLVMKAFTTNPKIAQNFLFALQSGATPARYGPLIATMIQKWQTDASREKQQQPQTQETQP